jgi:hypothetical protein
MKSSKRRYGIRAGIASLLLLLLVATTTGLAQDGVLQGHGENLSAPPQDIDPTPKILSRTVTPDAVHVTVELPVAQDTYISSNEPNRNFCNTNWLRVGYSQSSPGYGAVRMFMYFDLSSIPSDAAINWARFRIYMHSATPSGDSDMRLESRHLAAAWNQCQVTWSSHQPQWGPVFGSSWINSTPGWKEGDVTELVKDWVYGTHPNYGAMVMGDETMRERQRMFYSSREAGYHPRLIVDYTEYVDTEPPVISVDPLPQWSRSRFDVSWSGHDPGGSGIDYYDVEYSIPGGGWTQWLYHTRQTSAEFAGGANGTTYLFRARGVDKAGNVQAWSPTPQASTTVDSIPPAATANQLPPIILSPAFLVTWTGSDNSGGSGIAYFDLQYQENGGPWQDWIMGTTDTSVEVTGAENGSTYGLRVRATDVAGNVQPWSPTPQTETTINTDGPIAAIEPFPSPSTGADQFLVRWTGEAGPGLTVTGYDVRYRFKNGGWTQWMANTTLTQQTFTDLRAEDGVYCFEVRSTDSADRTGDFMGRQCIAVDRNPPFIEPQVYMPFVAKAP